MKHLLTIKHLLTLSIVVVSGISVGRAEHHESDATLQSQAKVSKAEASKAALAEVPNGRIKSSWIEKEEEKVLWSFDIAAPGSNKITEVAVNAMTGKVVSTEVEYPSDKKKTEEMSYGEEKDGSYKKESQTELLAQSKVTKAEATKATLAKYPHGKIRSTELKKWHGKLRWKFTLSMPKSRDMTEVAVDALTGEVVWTEVETPEDIKAEKAEKAAWMKKKQAWESKKKAEMARLLPLAKVSQRVATKTALAAVPNGSLKEDAELEKENGKLVWSFDMTKPGTSTITEIMVDAVTGAIVSNEKENAMDQKKEAAADKKERGW
jgi:uncharacterized membrane protein YkoI